MAQAEHTQPVPFHTFSGSHRDMGKQQGEALSGMIARGRKMLIESEEFNMARPAYLPRKMFLTLAQFGMWMKYSAHIQRYCPRQFERLLGIARGARVPPEYTLLLHAMEVEMNKVDYLMPGACTALGVRGTRALGGEPVIVKNFDYPEKFRELYIARLDAPAGRHRVLCSTAAPLAGNHDGVNEHGLVICYNYGYGQDEPRRNVPITLWVQEALETCRTTAEAVDLIKRGRRCGGALLMICDASGDLRTLEVSNTMAHERMPQHSVLINTNHYLDEMMARIDVPRDAVYTDRCVPPLRGVRCRESSEARYARALELLAAHDRIGDAELIAMASDHGAHGAPSDNTICRHSDYFSTTCSLVFYPARRAMKITHGNPCRSEFMEFSL